MEKKKLKNKTHNIRMSMNEQSNISLMQADCKEMNFFFATMMSIMLCKIMWKTYVSYFFDKGNSSWYSCLVLSFDCNNNMT